MPAGIHHVQDCLPTPVETHVLINDSVLLAAQSLLVGFCANFVVPQSKGSFKETLSLALSTNALPVLLVLSTRTAPSHSPGNLWMYAKDRLRPCKWI
jgi:hypothetical protein